jgi:transcriptional regulator GlxA family with amidase domain
VKVEPDAIFVRDGRVWTSAGVTSGIDLALALIENAGKKVAIDVARMLVVYGDTATGLSEALWLGGRISPNARRPDVPD